MPVDVKHLEECIGEAKRFLARAEVALEEAKQDPHSWMGSIRTWHVFWATASVRRSSMNLTRVLAQLRKY